MPRTITEIQSDIDKLNRQAVAGLITSREASRKFGNEMTLLKIEMKEANGETLTRTDTARKARLTK